MVRTVSHHGSVDLDRCRGGREAQRRVRWCEGRCRSREGPGQAVQDRRLSHHGGPRLDRQRDRAGGRLPVLETDARVPGATMTNVSLRFHDATEEVLMNHHIARSAPLAALFTILSVAGSAAQGTNTL